MSMVGETEKPSRPRRKRPPFECIALVLQGGGGALGTASGKPNLIDCFGYRCAKARSHPEKDFLADFTSITGMKERLWELPGVGACMKDPRRLPHKRLELHRGQRARYGLRRWQDRNRSQIWGPLQGISR